MIFFFRKKSVEKLEFFRVTVTKGLSTSVEFNGIDFDRQWHLNFDESDSNPVFCWKTKEDSTKRDRNDVFGVFDFPPNLLPYPPCLVNVKLSGIPAELPQDRSLEDAQGFISKFEAFQGGDNALSFKGQDFNAMYVDFLQRNVPDLNDILPKLEHGVESEGFVTCFDHPSMFWICLRRDFEKLVRFSNKLTEKLAHEMSQIPEADMSYNKIAKPNEICLLVSRIKNKIVGSRVCVGIEEGECVFIDAGGHVKVNKKATVKSFLDNEFDDVLLPFPGTPQWLDFFNYSSKQDWQKFHARAPFSSPCLTASHSDPIQPLFNQKSFFRFQVRDEKLCNGIKTHVIQVTHQ